MDGESKVKVFLLVLLVLLAVFYFMGFPSEWKLGTTTQQSTVQTTTTLQTVSSTTLAEIKTFKDNGGAIETKNGKPVIRMFSTTWCPHCKWVKDAYETTVMEYVQRGEIIAYHWELDIDDDTLTPEKVPVSDKEKKVFRAFNPGGGVPTFVFGSKYYRVGNGYEREKDLEAEKAEFRAVIEALLKEVKEMNSTSVQ